MGFLFDVVLSPLLLPSSLSASWYCALLRWFLLGQLISITVPLNQERLRFEHVAFRLVTQPVDVLVTM